MPSKVINKAIVAAILKLQDRGGRIDKYRVEEEARTNPSCPFRSWFTWDVEQAAMERRLDQAAELIRLVSVKVKDSSDRFVIAPVYVRDPTKKPNEAGHINVLNAANDPEVAQSVLEDAMKSIEELVARHRLLAKLLNVETELHEISAAVQAALKSIRKGRTQKGRREEARVGL